MRPHLKIKGEFSQLLMNDPWYQPLGIPKANFGDVHEDDDHTVDSGSISLLSSEEIDYLHSCRYPP